MSSTRTISPATGPSGIRVLRLQTGKSNPDTSKTLLSNIAPSRLIPIKDSTQLEDLIRSRPFAVHEPYNNLDLWENLLQGEWAPWRTLSPPPKLVTVKTIDTYLFPGIGPINLNDGVIVNSRNVDVNINPNQANMQEMKMGKKADTEQGDVDDADGSTLVVSAITTEQDITILVQFKEKAASRWEEVKKGRLHRRNWWTGFVEKTQEDKRLQKGSFEGKSNDNWRSMLPFKGEHWEKAGRPRGTGKTKEARSNEVRIRAINNITAKTRGVGRKAILPGVGSVSWKRLGVWNDEGLWENEGRVGECTFVYDKPNRIWQRGVWEGVGRKDAEQPVEVYRKLQRYRWPIPENNGIGPLRRTSVKEVDGY